MSFKHFMKNIFNDVKEWVTSKTKTLKAIRIVLAVVVSVLVVRFLINGPINFLVRKEMYELSNISIEALFQGYYFVWGGFVAALVIMLLNSIARWILGKGDQVSRSDSNR